MGASGVVRATWRWLSRADYFENPTAHFTGDTLSDSRNPLQGHCGREKVSFSIRELLAA
jgi:hypothetical protein